eukprot:COSAG05_NODE_2230_length_3362_cov_2.287466_3_plen_69_part_00
MCVWAYIGPIRTNLRTYGRTSYLCVWGRVSGLSLFMSGVFAIFKFKGAVSNLVPLALTRPFFVPPHHL